MPDYIIWIRLCINHGNLANFSEILRFFYTSSLSIITYTDYIKSKYRHSLVMLENMARTEFGSATTLVVTLRTYIPTYIGFGLRGPT